ncbi:MAG: hypothetical protein NT027_09620, partial [Proteobacteria bacterium]|nr:hypothetical protein [Pseudomonadota bacterium]
MEIEKKLRELGLKLTEETMTRCQIFEVEPNRKKEFRLVNAETFHFLYQVNKIDFGIYLGVESLMIFF